VPDRGRRGADVASVNRTDRPQGGTSPKEIS
jgi:hypothetical protein